MAARGLESLEKGQAQRENLQGKMIDYRPAKRVAVVHPSTNPAVGGQCSGR